MSSEPEKSRVSNDAPREAAASLLPTVNPAIVTETPFKPGSNLSSSLYVVLWIALSSSTILFNKYILDEHKLNFQFPIFLTTWHLAFATLMCQVLARTTTYLDERKKVPMTGRIYLRAIVPIGIFFSLSLICGNVAYLHLSVSFIQMLKATTPVAVLLASYGMGLKEPNMKTLFNVSFIVIGVMIATYGEIDFKWVGFLFQISGVVFEALRLSLVERLLSAPEYKMPPLVSLYYFAPVCAVLNGTIALFLEVPRMQSSDFARVGYLTLLANAVVAFLLNVSVVMLIGKTSAVVMTLCGVLKDILLVCASMVIYGSIVTFVQFFGYSIALLGMVHYKLGGEKIKAHIADGKRAWDEYGVVKPVQRKMVIASLVILTLFVVGGGLAPAAGYDVQEAYNGLISSKVPAPPS